MRPSLSSFVLVSAAFLGGGGILVFSFPLLFSFFFCFFFRSLFFHTFTFQLLDKPWSQVSSLLPPGFCLQFFIAHRVQQSHCPSIFRRVLLTHALALSASQVVHKKKSQCIYTSMHSAGLELAKLTYTRLEDSLIRHRGDRCTFCIRCQVPHSKYCRMCN